MKFKNILTVKTVKFSKEYEGQLVEWWVKDKALTPKLMQTFVDVEKRPIELANGLAQIVTQWSVFLEEEGDFPPTSENLSICPMEFITFLIDSIAETWQGGKPVSGSPNTSAASEN